MNRDAKAEEEVQVVVAKEYKQTQKGKAKMVGIVEKAKIGELTAGYAQVMQNANLATQFATRFCRLFFCYYRAFGRVVVT